jgi:hypothetical protein
MALNLDQLFGLLRQAQRDLLGFLDAVRAWAREFAPERGDQLVAAVDRGLSISAPLLVVGQY